MSIEMIGRPMPQAVELEAAVIGAILMEPSVVSIGMEVLNADFFYKREHKEVFKAIQSLYTQRKLIDPLTVVQELKAMRQLEHIGGAYFVTQLTNNVMSAWNIQEHSMYVLQKFLRRKIIEISSSHIESAYDDHIDTAELLDRVVHDSKSLYDYVSFGSLMTTGKILEDIMEAVEHKTVAGPKSLIKDLDDYLINFEPGLKYTIGGRPSMGKTSLAKTLGINFINQGYPGAFFSMEMSKQQLMITFVAGLCSIDSKIIRKKELSVDQKKAIHTQMTTFRTDHLIIDDKSTMTPNYIAKRVKKFVRDNGIKWFASDYTQMGKIDNPKGKMKEERIGEFSQGLKDIAKEENIIALEISQLTRSDKSSKVKRPTLEDLKDSGTIEASADVVLLLYRPEYCGHKTVHGQDSAGMAEIIVAKQRGGDTGTAAAKYIKEFTRFETWEKTSSDVVIQPGDDTLDF